MISKISRVSGVVLHATHDWRFPKSPVPWAEITEADLEPQGPPEFHRRCRVATGQYEKHCAMFVRGEHVPDLGLLAVRYTDTTKGQCEPLGIALADDPFVGEHVQADGDSRPEGD